MTVTVTAERLYRLAVRGVRLPVGAAADAFDVKTVHVVVMTTSTPAGHDISDAELALVRRCASASVDEAPPLAPELAKRIATYLAKAPDAIRDAS